MQKVSEFHGIKLSNIPLYNLREQFYNHYHMVKSGEFANQISEFPEAPVNTPYLEWHYWPNVLFTYLTQQSIMGVEAYLTGAVYDVLGQSGRLRENIDYLRNPFSLPGEKGTAAKYYKLMPSLFSKEISLPHMNSQLWGDVRVFYKEVRNPLFHGMQLDTNSPSDLIRIFELLADIYEWVDTWHNPDNIIMGSSWFTKLNRT